MSETNAEATSGRGAAGRFGPGNAFAKGNPQHLRMRRLRQALLDSVGEGRVATIGAKLATLAEGGDVQAAKLLLEYLVGRPAQALELSGPDGEPLGVDWGRAEAAILAALKPFGDQARFAVALAIRGVVNDAGAEPAGD